MKRIIVIISVFLMSYSLGDAKDVKLEHFITAKGDQLYEGQVPFRFVSFNVPNLHCIEDNMQFDTTNFWRLPDRFEIEDALKTIKLLNGHVARIYTLSVLKQDDPPEIPRYILGPGEFNEEAFRTLDQILASANKIGVRLIIPLVDNWSWMGGISEYAAFRGKDPDDFWTDPQIIADFKKTIDYVLNRENTITGTRYKNDKAILGWEPGNELRCPDEWTREIAEFIQNRDNQHLVIDGYQNSVLRDESLKNPFIDVVTSHHYENHPLDMEKHIRENAEKARGVKPYLIGEFGWLMPPSLDRLLNQIVNEKGICGALYWSLRFHNRDGGFYRHSEPAIGGLFKSYHFPGFPSGHANAETGVLQTIRSQAFAIGKEKLVPIPAPCAPVMLEPADPGRISWQGAAGASGYNLERSQSPQGPWQQIAWHISDAAVAYFPLFNDHTAQIGNAYFYRIRAVNVSGISPPSNIAGPLNIEFKTLVDNLTNFGKVYFHRGTFSFESEKARRMREDLDRLKGEPESELVYYVPGKIKQVKIFSYSETEQTDYTALASNNGQDYAPVSMSHESYIKKHKQYDYWVPTLYTIKPEFDICFIKLIFRNTAQIGRIEIDYAE